MDALIALLHEGQYSCVVRNGAETRTFTQRGVADLLNILDNTPDFLHGALVADKVVGKGAAALMVMGKVREVYAEVISTPALHLLKANGVNVSYTEEAARIVNRTKNGLCPVETLCLDLCEPEEMLIRIRNFINKK